MNIRNFNIRFQHCDIKVKLPKGYFKRKAGPYPLVIVQDGDDLFKDIEREVIFVGLVQNDNDKIYAAWQDKVEDESFYSAVDDYLLWISDQLLPYLKKCFNVSEQRLDISIAGASLGGLVVLYALFKKPDTFGTYILISPSIWYPGFLTFMKQQPIIKEEEHVYWYIGTLEDEQHPEINTNILAQTEQGVDILNELLISEQITFHFVTNNKELHQQIYFKKYFNKAVKKLF
ncbi:alpha/beta hydrolase [Staphylococcus equorum]|uniref:alpha/beta hydrolase n=1 Tax=Staphylococcus equorum TaxID=246432 RepID=UPI003F7AA913